MNNLTPAALNIAAKFDTLPPNLRDNLETLIGAAAEQPDGHAVPLPEDEPEEQGEPAPKPVTDPIPVGPGVIAEHPERDLTGEELFLECCYRAIAGLKVLERELDPMPGEEGKPDFTLARFRRVFRMIEDGLEDQFESIGRHDMLEYADNACAQLYGGLRAVRDRIAGTDNDCPEDALYEIRAIFSMVQPAMILRVGAVMGDVERTRAAEIEGVRQ